MCDLFLQNYSGVINNWPDITSDLQPTLTFFTGTDSTGISNCLGTMSPHDAKTGNFTSFSYPFNTRFTFASIGFPTTVRTIYIPFSFAVTFFGIGGGGDVTSQFTGPMLIDTTVTNWQSFDPPLSVVPGTTLFETPINEVLITRKDDWDTLVHSMCMGQTHNLGVNPLTRFNPAGERCDYFMEKQFCIGANLHSDESCGCYSDLIDVEQRSIMDGVNLPVLCFGQKCATERTYKSALVLSKPCNMTICQQFISGANTGNKTVFCGGHFYDNVGDFVPALISPVPAIAPGNNGDESWVVWVLLAVSTLMIGLLFGLMLWSGNRVSKPKSIGSQV